MRKILLDISCAMPLSYFEFLKHCHRTRSVLNGYQRVCIIIITIVHSLYHFNIQFEITLVFKIEFVWILQRA